jgi:hypothetical protein
MLSHQKSAELMLVIRRLPPRTQATSAALQDVRVVYLANQPVESEDWTELRRESFLDVTNKVALSWHWSLHSL